MKKRLDEELDKISTSVSENSAAIRGLSNTSSINEKLNGLTTSISENATSVHENSILIKELSSTIKDSQGSGKAGMLYQKETLLY